MFNKVLIANRGEIALRVIRSCRELGIRTVAVYSESDADSLHVRFADEDVCIGPSPSAQSYLHIPNLISAAEVSDADAIHPGYGFLSENPQFARICRECHIEFIGPPADVIEKMGDKAEAKAMARAAGIPVIPGSGGPVRTPEEGLDAARQCGFPVFVKAVAGGGGRGMRLIQTPQQFNNSFQAAAGEALAAFGNGELYVEKYLHNPKHIEVQIMADKHGNVVHVGERDCSIQRRRQKLIEETPCCVLPNAVRERITEAAVALARSVDYVGAGTVEFLWDQKDQFYFLEMNTRLQVEHPVTEVVTLWDLVKEQIRIAAGERLSRTQAEVKPCGHAIECRINAEDPDRGFIPSPGRIITYHPPGGNGVRIDSHIYQEYVVPPHYDSLVSKIIVRAHDRDEAIRRMVRSLDEYIIEGIRTTIPFHLKMMENARFQQGDFGIQFLEEDFGL